VIALAMAFAASVGLIVLSVPAAKDPLHVLGVVPFLYLLAGTSLAELETDAPKYRPANVATVQAVVIVSVLSVIAMWGAHLGGAVGVRFSVLYSLGMLGVVAIGAAWLARKQLTLPLLAVCALAFVAFVAGV
jgi:hypothetical protein